MLLRINIGRKAPKRMPHTVSW